MSIKGNGAFNRCGVKNVVVSEYFKYTDGQTQPSIVETEHLDTSHPYFFNGFGARLECPRIEDGSDGIVSNRDSHSRVAAVRSLRKLAGTALCQGCPYPDMTPPEVAQQRLEVAEVEQKLYQIDAVAEQVLPPPPQIAPA